jgi:glycosyltransferase involved in cell wall biosynthesis
MVVHYEGVSSGRDLSAGVKRYQVVNHAKFYERWKDVLAQHRPNGESTEFEKERPVARRLLMVDATTPQPDRDAGSVTAEHLIGIFQQLGYKVTFAPENLRFDPKYTARLQRRGVECIYYPHEHDLRRFLRRRGAEFDVVFVARPYIADSILRRVRDSCPGAKLVYNTVDLHYLREAHQAELEKNPALARRAESTKATELRVIAAADCSIVLSVAEREILRRELPQARVEVIPLILEEQAAGAAFAARRGLIFIGGSRHPPNADGVLYFVREIMPALRAAGGADTLYVIGERSPAETEALRAADVQVLGQVEDIAPYFHSARGMVVPLRYGAGIKGKIGTAYAYGLPVISTAVGAEGMDLEEERDYLRADSVAEWVAQVRRLGEDQALWLRLSEAGRRVVRERYAPDRAASQIRRILQTP